jgi:hypothetical protein
MADKKISALTALTAANVAPATDVVPIVDTSATETKKVTAKDLVDGALNGGTANGVLYLNGSKAATSGSDLAYNGTNLALGGSVGTTPSLNRGFYVQSDTNNHVIGYSLYVNEGANNRRGSMFLDDSAGLWGWDVTASSGVPSYVWRSVSVEQMRLNDSGNLGIGTSSPATKLHIDTATAGYGLTLAASSLTARTYRFGLDSSANLALFDSNAAAVRLTLDTSGNLGIGTSSPAYRLDVVGDAKIRPSSGYNAVFEVSGSALRINYLNDALSANVSATFRAADFVFQTAGATERARITSDGNIVAGGSSALATTATNGFLYVPTCAGTPTGTPTAITGMAPIVVNTTNNKLYFYSGGAWRDAGP